VPLPRPGRLFMSLVEEEIKRIGVLSLPLSEYEADRIALCQALGYSATTIAQRMSPVLLRARVLGLETVPLTREDFPELYERKGS